MHLQSECKWESACMTVNKCNFLLLLVSTIYICLYARELTTCCIMVIYIYTIRFQHTYWKYFISIGILTNYTNVNELYNVFSLLFSLLHSSFHLFSQICDFKCMRVCETIHPLSLLSSRFFDIRYNNRFLLIAAHFSRIR